MSMIRAAASALSTTRTCCAHRAVSVSARHLTLSTSPSQTLQRSRVPLPFSETTYDMVKGAKRAREDVKASATTAAAEGAHAGSEGAAATGAHAQGLVDFLNVAWTPYHAVEEASRRLLAAGEQLRCLGKARVPAARWGGKLGGRRDVAITGQCSVSQKGSSPGWSRNMRVTVVPGKQGSRPDTRAGDGPAWG